MVEYADRSGLDEDVNRAFVRIMRQIDAEKLRRQRDRNSASDIETSPRAENLLNVAADNVAVQTASKEQMRAAAKRRAGNVRKGNT